MKGLFIFVAGIFFAISCSHSKLETSEASLTSDRMDEGPNVSPPTNSFVKFPSNTEIYVAQDGMVYLVDLNSEKILWSFKSGPPINASSKAIVVRDNFNVSEPIEFFIYYGEDKNLYMELPNHYKRKFLWSAEEFIDNCPFASAHCEIYGSKNTTLFNINDPKTGKASYCSMIGQHTFKNILDAEENPNMLEDDFKKLIHSPRLHFKHKDHPIYVLRKDYRIEYHSIKTKTLLWYLTFSDIEASLHSEYSFYAEDDVNSKIEDSAISLESLNHRSMIFPLFAPDGMIPGVKTDLLGVIAMPADGSSPNFLNGSYIWSWSVLLFVFVIVSSLTIIFYLKMFGHGRAEKNVPITEMVLNPEDRGRGSYTVGSMSISNKEIARGSNGTVVLEGLYAGRKVAIKRLVQTHYDVAHNEIQNLIMSDRHPNIVRLFGFEQDQHFAYLSLERCICNLGELISFCHASFQNEAPREDQDPRMNQFQNIELWKPNGQPSAQLLKILRDIVSGLAHLHDLGIVHRDLKPQNILIVNEKSISAKISDMGISKRLSDNMLSLSSTGLGTLGWQAPEQLNRGQLTQAIDSFNLGCLFFFCLTGGKHPYGDNFERTANIVSGRKDLFLLNDNPEATDFIDALLDPNPDLRSKAMQLLCHPFFWDSDKRISFLCDVSNRTELEIRVYNSKFLSALESISYNAFGQRWNGKINAVILNGMGTYKRYNYKRVRDLLRVVRNTHSHYWELSTDIQEILGVIPDEFDNYFRTQFPKLLMQVYKVLFRDYNGEESFKKYFEPIS